MRRIRKQRPNAGPEGRLSSARRPSTRYRRQCRRAAACLAVAAASALASAAPGASAPSASERLSSLLAGLTTFGADFEQVVASERGTALQTSTGRIEFKRPGRLRWEVDDPWPQLVLADGESLWIHDPDLAQVTVRRLGDAEPGSPALLLLESSASLGGTFDVEDADREGGFILRPRGETSVYRELEVEFAPEGVIERLAVVDHLGRFTSIRFDNAAAGVELADAVFEFEVPPGTDVIGELPDGAAESF